MLLRMSTRDSVPLTEMVLVWEKISFTPIVVIHRPTGALLDADTKRMKSPVLFTRTNSLISKSSTCISLIKLVSIECCKTKTKVITLANQKGRRQSSKPIKTRSNYT